MIDHEAGRPAFVRLTSERRWVIATVLVIGDLHEPWGHPEAVPFLERVARRVRADVVVHIGDEIDGHRWSRHPQSPDLPGPAEELEMARERLRPIFELFPEVLVCHSNHTLRIAKRAADAGLPGRSVRTMAEILDAPPGWKWDHWHEIDGVQYRHGDGFSGKNGVMKAVEKLRRSVVMGHLHSQAGVWYSQVQGGPRLLACAVGCLVDPDAEAFSYGRYFADRPVLGAAVVRDGKEAHFLPLE